MSDYHVVDASTNEGLASFDKFREAKAAYERLECRRSCNLLVLHGCGCVYRALFRGQKPKTKLVRVRLRDRKPGGPIWVEKEVPAKRKHVGWRRSEVCLYHDEKSKAK